MNFAAKGELLTYCKRKYVQFREKRYEGRQYYKTALRISILRNENFNINGFAEA